MYHLSFMIYDMIPIVVCHLVLPHLNPRKKDVVMANKKSWNDLTWHLITHKYKNVTIRAWCDTINILFWWSRCSEREEMRKIILIVALQSDRKRTVGNCIVCNYCSVAADSITCLVWIYIQHILEKKNPSHSANIDMGKTCWNGNVTEWLIWPLWNIQSNMSINENGRCRNRVGSRGSRETWNR